MKRVLYAGCVSIEYDWHRTSLRNLLFYEIVCMHKIGFLQEEDFPAIVLRIFVSYLGVMRRLQTVYMLEPAGSHGVWGLDDYQCLVFYFGAAQMLGKCFAFFS